jgi:hypothetical protein
MLYRVYTGSLSLYTGSHRPQIKLVLTARMDLDCPDKTPPCLTPFFGNMLDVTLVLSAGLALLLGYLVVNRQGKHQPLEPPLIPSPIPVIGHLAAFIYYGLQYFPSQR